MKKCLFTLLLFILVTKAFPQWQYTGLSNGYGVRSLISDGNNLYAGALQGVFQFENSTGLWVPNSNGMSNLCANALAYSNNFLFVGTSGVCSANACGVLTAPVGGSWTTVSNGLPNDRFTSLELSGNLIFAGTETSGIYISSNNGLNWIASNTGLTDLHITDFALNSTGIFAATFNDGVFFSSDNGLTWTMMNNGLFNTTVLSLAANGIMVAAGTDAGVYISFDNGITWNAPGSGIVGLPISSIAISGSAIFAASGGVFQSNDGGISWLSINSGLTTTNVWELFIWNNEIYAGCEPGVFKRPLSELTSLSDDIYTNINVYPNPFTNVIRINDLRNGDELHILDSTGREIIYEKVANNMKDVNTSRLAPGIYVINIIINEKNSYCKMVKSR